MSDQGFTVEVFQNEFLPDDGSDVNAIVTVTSPDSAPPQQTLSADAAEIIIIDCSGSMGAPQSKIVEARAATSAAIDAIRDGVAFAAIAGTERATPVFPYNGTLAFADDGSRAEAKRAVAACGLAAAPRLASGCGWPARCSAPTRQSCGTPSC
jgi:hypothetical protein